MPMTATLLYQTTKLLQTSSFCMVESPSVKKLLSIVRPLEYYTLALSPLAPILGDPLESFKPSRKPKSEETRPS